MGEEKGEPMKRPLTIVAMLAALAVPALVSAQQANPPVSSGAATARAERGWVDPAQLSHLLEAKGLITPQEEGVDASQGGASGRRPDATKNLPEKAVSRRVTDRAR